MGDKIMAPFNININIKIININNILLMLILTLALFWWIAIPEGLGVWVPKKEEEEEASGVTIPVEGPRRVRWYSRPQMAAPCPFSTCGPTRGGFGEDCRSGGMGGRIVATGRKRVCPCGVCVCVYAVWLWGCRCFEC